VGNRATQVRMENVVKELFGEASGDPTAKGLADLWAQVSEDLRLRFNAAGGSIAKLDKWGLPQHHIQEDLMHYGRQKWIDYMMQPDVLDRERMTHPLTGRRMTGEELQESLGVTT
jgi:hypothetical protein